MKHLLLGILLTLNFMQAKDSTRQIIRDHYHFSTKGHTELIAQIHYGIGELILTPSENRFDIDGVIQYDPSFMEPIVDLHSRGKTAELSVDINSKDSSYHMPINEFKDLRIFSRNSNNIMDFSLPVSIPITLDLEFGFGSAEIDLSGMRIADLDLECGLSDVNIVSNAMNPIECRRIKLESGLGDLNIVGLGNIHARSIDLEIGLGSADIDFRGDRLVDTNFDIEVGLGDLDLILPERANIKVYVNDTFLSSVSVYGLIEEDEDEWISPNWRPGLPVIKLDVSVGLGSIDISVKD
ncbi:MAG: hypothetical protein HQ509_08160 [Candidatus Marinimicrobia bacterium]|nr:hypothetical protein [Candidatus Neomarinimicrobiota bacterium]